MGKTAKICGYFAVCAVSAVMYNITAYLGAGISSVISILVFACVYAVIQYILFRKLKNLSIKSFSFCVLAIILMSAVLGLILFYKTNLFVRIFIMFNGDYGMPGAGSGFGMITSYRLNTYVLIALTVANCCKRLINVKSKHIETGKINQTAKKSNS